MLVPGVVYAPCYPGDDRDLFAWADGCRPVPRNRNPITANLSDKQMKGSDDVPAIVFIFLDAEACP